MVSYMVRCCNMKVIWFSVGFGKVVVFQCRM